MELHPTTIPGCFEVEFDNRVDARGTFIKTVQSSVFAKCGLDSKFLESFYTRSEGNVLRGMHLQLPPSDGAKLVYCLEGAVLDVALDLRPDSPTLGAFCTFELSASAHTAAYLPRGVAHGFYVRDAPSLMMYHVCAEFDPQRDTGVRWDSFGFEWPSSNPVISPRDANLPSFFEFLAAH